MFPRCLKERLIFGFIKKRTAIILPHHRELWESNSLGARAQGQVLFQLFPLGRAETNGDFMAHNGET
jgi:hypothetical protein